MQGFYAEAQNNGSTICFSCPLECTFCNENGCLYCAVGYYSAPVTNLSTFIPTTVDCIPCALTGCVSCFNAMYCLSCNQTGFSTVPTIFGKCVNCLKNCLQCDQSLVCSLCEAGFLLNVDRNICLD